MAKPWDSEAEFLFYSLAYHIFGQKNLLLAIEQIVKYKDYPESQWNWKVDRVANTINLAEVFQI